MSKVRRPLHPSPLKGMVDLALCYPYVQPDSPFLKVLASQIPKLIAIIDDLFRVYYIIGKRATLQ